MSDNTNASPALTERLAEVVRAKHRFFTARALVLAGLGCLLLGTVIIGADVGLAFGPMGRWLGFGLLVLALGLILGSRLVMPCRRYHEHEAVRDLESACDGRSEERRVGKECS